MHECCSSTSLLIQTEDKMRSLEAQLVFHSMITVLEQEWEQGG